MANGMLSMYNSAFVSLFGNDESQYVDENEHEILSQELKDAQKKVSVLGTELDKKQGNSIHIAMSDMSIRAKNFVEFLFKKAKSNRIVENLIDKITVKSEKGNLPKTGFVKAAEENIVKVDSQRAMKNVQERGGEERTIRGR